MCSEYTTRLRPMFMEVYLSENVGGGIGLDPHCTYESSLSEAQEALSNVDPEFFHDISLTNMCAPSALSGSFVSLSCKAAKKGGRNSIVMISSHASMIWNPWWSLNSKLFKFNSLC